MLKVLSRFVADDTLKLILLFFRENKTWHFTWITWNVKLYFFLKKKKKKKKSNCCLHYGNVFCDCGLQIKSDLDYKCRMLKWFCESCILVDVTFWAGSIQEKQKNRRYEHVGDGVGLVVVVFFHMSVHYVLVLVRVSNKNCLLAISCVHVCVFLLGFFYAK